MFARKAFKKHAPKDAQKTRARGTQRELTFTELEIEGFDDSKYTDSSTKIAKESCNMEIKERLKMTKVSEYVSAFPVEHGAI